MQKLAGGTGWLMKMKLRERKERIICDKLDIFPHFLLYRAKESPPKSLLNDTEVYVT